MIILVEIFIWNIIYENEFRK